MRHPFQLCATKYCCFCLSFSSQVTCLIIAVLCIAVNAFSSATNFGIHHVALYVMSNINFVLHLLAGVLLFLGAIWGKDGLKLAYCWLTFIGIFAVITAFALYLVYRKDGYVIWDAYTTTAGLVIVCIHTVWLLLWDIYTPMVVLGNIYEDFDCCV